MKKLLYVLSLLIIVSMILTACGGIPAPASPAENGTNAEGPSTGGADQYEDIFGCKKHGIPMDVCHVPGLWMAYATQPTSGEEPSHIDSRWTLQYSWDFKGPMILKWVRQGEVAHIQEVAVGDCYYGSQLWLEENSDGSHNYGTEQCGDIISPTPVPLPPMPSG